MTNQIDVIKLTNLPDSQLCQVETQHFLQYMVEFEVNPHLSYLKTSPAQHRHLTTPSAYDDDVGRSYYHKSPYLFQDDANTQEKYLAVLEHWFIFYVNRHQVSCNIMSPLHFLPAVRNLIVKAILDNSGQPCLPSLTNL
jgi:hypothetical protein